MTSPRSDRRRGRIGRLSLSLLTAAGLISCLAPRPAPAQDKAKADAARAAGVFDDDTTAPASKSKTKADEAAKAKEKAQAKTASERDAIGFTQENVAAQMTELEERMF